MNPFLIAAANAAQANAWRLFYKNFYATHPERVPQDVVLAWYTEASALRTNATAQYNADRHVFKDVPNITLIAEVDSTPLKLDQLRHFRDVQSKAAPSALFYMRKTGHGMVVDWRASDSIVHMIAQASTKQWDMVNLSERVYEVVFDNDGTWQIRPISLDTLIAENEGNKPSEPKPQGE
jgi:hypothetical protein